MEVTQGFTFSSSIIIAALLVAYGLFTKYAESEVQSDQSVDDYYMYYVHVAGMIFVGFGFLMTFLKKYAFGAVGFNFLLSSLAVLCAVIFVGVADQCGGGTCQTTIGIGLPLLIKGLFAAGAVMISYGAVLGKATPTHLLWMTVSEVAAFSIAGYLIDHVFHMADLGGSIAIHAFGAYFGLTVSLFLSPPGSGLDHPVLTSTYTTDITAMIGTLFLWILWPSFNAAVAETGPLARGQQFRAIVNTVLGLLASCLATFAWSGVVSRGKFSMIHVQNATLAGGVAIGSSANLFMEPGGALATGLVAGSVSTLGYAFAQPYLEAKFGLRDTCGVHNLHGMPGVLGGLVSAIVSFFNYAPNAYMFERGAHQWVWQVVGLAVTLIIAVTSGSLTGLALKYGCPRSGLEYMFDDAHAWVMEEEAGYEHLDGNPT